MRLLIVCLLAGCTLYENKAGDDMPGDDGSGSGSGSGGPVGQSFLLQRVPSDSGSPACPDFNEENRSHSIVVESSQVRVDGFGASAVIRNTPAREPGDAPNVTFNVIEQWNSIDGPAAPEVAYQLWVDGSLLTGTATTGFTFNSTDGLISCAYFWRATRSSP